MPPGPAASDAEFAYWVSIRDSENTADYADYLETFPEGRFVRLARIRIERYREVVDPKELEGLAESKLQQLKHTEVNADDIDVYPNLAIKRARSAASAGD
jgi:hypothetical protein